MRTGEREFSSNRAFLSAVVAVLARHIVLLMLMVFGAIIIVISDMFQDNKLSRQLLFLFALGAAQFVAAVLYFRFVRNWIRWLGLACGLAVVWFLGAMVLRVWF
jgi:hypothetical protein